MNKRTLRRLISVLAVLALGLSLLTGCGTKSPEQVQEQEDARPFRCICGAIACTKAMLPMSKRSCRT